MSITLINLISLSLALVVFFGYGIFLLYRMRREASKEKFDWSRRLGKISSAEETAESTLTLLKSHPDPDTYFKSKLPKIEGLKEWIQHAGLDIKPPVLIGIGVGLGAMVALFFFIFVGANGLFSLLIGVASGFVVPWAFIAILTRRVKNKFLDEFPIALDMIRRALRAGHSADRALDMVAEQETGPVGEAFKAITDKMRMGGTAEAVLAEMSNRVGIDDFRMLAIVMVLQRETGGSLAEATENFSKIIRARQNLRKKVKALTAEVRVTAAILTSLPFFILGAVYFTQPHYLDSLFYTEDGHKLLIIGGVMLTIGITMIIRLAYKEIY